MVQSLLRPLVLLGEAKPEIWEEGCLRRFSDVLQGELHKLREQENGK